MRILSIALLLTSFTLLAKTGFAQNYYPPIVNYSTQDYGKDKNPENFCVVQDNRGVMYFGSAHGILEYDGKKWNFIVVNPGSFVRALAVDSSGVVYVGTYGDFGYLEPDRRGQLVFHSLLDDLPEDDQFFSDIWKIYCSDDQVFFQAYESFFVFHPESGELETVYPQDFESTFHTSFLVDGTYYLRERGFGLVKYENGGLQTIEGTDTIRNYGVFGIHKLEGDTLLVITQELGLWKWSGGAMARIPELNKYPTTSFGIFGSVELSDGHYGVYTATNGVLILDTNGKIVKEINRSKGMRSNEVKGIFEDRDQNIWLTLGNGISKVNYHSPLSYFNEKSGIEGNVQAMIRFNGQLYVGTSFGLFIQDFSEEKTHEFRNAMLLNNQVWDFCQVDDQLYIATSNGVFKTSNGLQFVQINGRNTNVLLYLNEEQRFLGAGADGIYAYNRSFAPIWGEEMNLTTVLSGMIDPNYENTLWLGTISNGVFRLQWDQDEYILDSYGVFDGLNDNQLGKPILFQNQVVFGTTEGLLGFIHEDDMVSELPDSLKNDPDYYRGMFQVTTLHDSIFSAQILLVEEDKDRTWYCADDKIGFYDYKTKEFINKPFWGINYGRVNEFYLEDNGVFWIGCADGLVRYEKNDQKQYKSTFYSLIREFAINRDSTVFSGAFTDENGKLNYKQGANDKIELAYDFNDVYFAFAAPYFEDEHIPEFSFILEGHDDKWSDWGSKTEANFTNLHEGDYVFRVKARNIYGHISEEAEYRFTILPPWYRTTWAYILYGCAFILIFFVGVKISSARLKAKNQWLEGVVEERTKEIKQKNIVLQHQKQEIEDSINYAQRIQEAILPLEAEMKKWIPRSFVLFRPKDIVSGDFYWFMEKDNKLVFVCADCTGHGVPGAFMSMIGSDRLNNIVSERRITDPGQILSEMNQAIKKSLKQDGHKQSTRDGMDAAICTIDLDKKELKFAGANRPLWVIKDGGEVEEIKATKVAVAGFTSDDQEYEEHTIPLTGGLKFYMTSDGYADQFGGDRGKKYKVKQMKEFIQQHCFQGFDFQRIKLEEELVGWMGDHEQVDDVCVIGFEP